MYYIRGNYACRHCFGLKYRIQYEKGAATKRALLKRKVQRYNVQERRLWYDGYKTQYGKRYYKYLDEMEELQTKINEELAFTAHKMQRSVERLLAA